MIVLLYLFETAGDFTDLIREIGHAIVILALCDQVSLKNLYVNKAYRVWREYYIIQVILSACPGHPFFFFLNVFLPSLYTPHRPKIWENVAIVSKHLLNACFTKFLMVAVQ